MSGVKAGANTIQKEINAITTVNTAKAWGHIYLMGNMVVINITREDIANAWRPTSDSARIYHGPLAVSVARLLDKPFEYIMTGCAYYNIKFKDGTIENWDIVEWDRACQWSLAFDTGKPVSPIVFHARLIKTVNDLAKAWSGKVRRYKKDIDTRREGSDESSDG